MPTKRIEKGITRFDVHEQNTYGYMVRITRKGKTTSQFFSDKLNGGKRKALVAARDHYQKLVNELPPISTTKGIKSARNTSGAVGVHLASTPSQTWSDVEYQAYVASWRSGEGARCKISFSLEKYGKKKAFDLACIARENECLDRSKVEGIYGRRKKRRSTKKRSKAKR